MSPNATENGANRIFKKHRFHAILRLLTRHPASRAGHIKRLETPLSSSRGADPAI